MKGISVSLLAETASFRDPGAQLYHSSLGLPPYFTIVGIAGAALGKSFDEAVKYFEENKIYVGVYGKSAGNGKDLWNYQKVVSSKPVGKDIIVREFLYRLNVSLVYAAADIEIIYQLREAFLNPCYALSLGTSDELAKVVKVSDVVEVQEVEVEKVYNTVIAGDLSGQFELDWETIRKMPLKKTIKAPSVKKLPVRFSFNSEGVRKASEYATFTFLEEGLIELKNKIKAYRVVETVVPLFGLDNCKGSGLSVLGET